MTSPSSPTSPISSTSPISAVRLPDPYPYYATLVAERPFAYDDDLSAWVASDAEAVTAVLRAEALRVRPPAEPVPAGIVGTPAGEVFGSLVRMTDGDVRGRLKRVVVDALGHADLAAAARLAADRTRAVLARGGEVPYEELMFGVPARVVAGLCGLDAGVDDEAARLIGDFVQCIPATATPDQQRAAAEAAGQLQKLLGPGIERAADGLLGDLVRAARAADWADTAPLLANAIGFLSQTYDATAGLIGNTLVALARGHAVPPTADGLELLVREVVRYDAPIQNTRRFAARPFRHRGAEVEPGQSVLVLLAAANRDPAANADPHTLRPGRPDPTVFTFGADAHHCPGRDLAVAIATATIDTLLTSGAHPSTLPTTPAYRPLANARIPLL
ncbi:Cytochrome P450 [Streptomyces sp. yr375]|uniref:cytochrome P450 n=1 Tax=Streptomyces sp. yr375 TaxID=1761906 RepID=UPI0008ADC7BF|nr:cytochrome P450 [Streptomyces sp. yr375]SES04953.1 Cytochrome P450 [Streptomyces sp. yr375]